MKRQTKSIRGSYRQDEAFIAADDMEDGKDITLTIADVVETTIRGQANKKVEALTFEELLDDEKKPRKFYHLNKERKAQIVIKTKKRNYEDWIGQKITLYKSTTKLFGETVPCVHVRTK